MSDEPQDLQALTGAPRSKWMGAAFVVVSVGLIYGGMVWFERTAVAEAVAKLGCKEDASLGMATRDEIEDVPFDAYSVRACNNQYSIAVTPVFRWGLLPPRVGVGLPVILDAHIGATPNVEVIRARVTELTKE